MLVLEMEHWYPVRYERRELEKRPEETIENAAQVFQTVGRIFLGLAAVFGGLAALSRFLEKSQ